MLDFTQIPQFLTDPHNPLSWILASAIFLSSVNAVINALTNLLHEIKSTDKPQFQSQESSQITQAKLEGSRGTKS